MCPAWPLKVSSCSPVYLWLQCCADGCCGCGLLPQVNLAPRTRSMAQLYFSSVVSGDTCSWFYFLIFKDILEICTVNTIRIINPKGLNSFFPPCLRHLSFKGIYVRNYLWKSWSYLIGFLSRFVFWMLKLGTAKDVNIKTSSVLYITV